MYYFKKVYNIIPHNLLSKIPVLLFLLLVNSFFEIVSLGSIIPLLQTILDPNFSLVFFNKIENLFIKDFLLSLSQKEQILFFSFILIIVFMLKYLFYIVTLDYNLNYSKKLSIELTKSVVLAYFKNSYTFFSRTNLSSKITDIFVGIRYLTTFYVKSFLNLILEIFLIIFISILILYIDPFASAVAITFFLTISYLFFKINKKKLDHFSNLTQFYDKKRVKSLHEIITLFKEVIIFKKEDFFYKNFLTNLSLFEVNTKKINFLKILPRPILEFFGTITIIIFLIVSFYSSNDDLSQIVIKIAIIAAAGFRLLPSINRAMVSILEIKSSIPYVISVLKSNLLKKNKNKNKNNFLVNKKIIHINNAISFKNISFGYSKKTRIIHNLDLKIERNDKVGIIGRSGEGKTTLLEIICGLYEPTNGTVIIDNKKYSFKDLKNLSISYVSQNNILFEGSIVENITFGIKKEAIDINKVKFIVKLVGLQSFINSLQGKLETTIGEMGSKISGGQKQRISIARALYHDAQILIFDEATNSLDRITEDKIIKNIKKNFSTKMIIFVSHKKSAINFCNKILKLENKKLVRIK